MKFIDEFRNPEIAAKISSEIRRIMPEKRLSIMEVCGGHTVAIFRYGIADLLPENLRLISGPGCPVCVTPNDFIDVAHFISRQKGTIVATFGDMMRVPGSESSLQREKSSGADVRICYSPSEALELAESNPTKRVVFLGIGFETTAPLIASVILSAERKKVRNFSVLSGHKTMPFAMKALLDSRETAIDGFICPGHVSAITGSEMFRFLSRDYHVPCVVSGFEPVDILESIYLIVRQITDGDSRVELQYKRAVRPEGNLRALEMIERVFEPCDSIWRGLGSIANSGLRIRSEYSGFDAAKIFDIPLTEITENPACSCGEIMRGVKTPPDCTLFGKICTPENPVGACMVSSEGTCAAWFKYKKVDEI